jgi:hypothetical protein
VTVPSTGLPGESAADNTVVLGTEMLTEHNIELRRS